MDDYQTKQDPEAIRDLGNSGNRILMAEKRRILNGLAKLSLTKRQLSKIKLTEQDRQYIEGLSH